MQTAIIGKTYTGTMAHTRLVKNRGGYYTGYRKQATGKIIEVTCRADCFQAGWYWGEWIETCETQRKVRNCFHPEVFERLQLKAP
jgi:hypothetical protein